MFFLLLVATLFIRESWKPYSYQEQILFQKNDWIVTTPFPLQAAAMYAYLLMLFVVFEGRTGLADWVLAVYYGLPENITYPIVSVIHKDEKEPWLQVKPATAFCVGCWIVCQSKSLYSILFYTALEWSIRNHRCIRRWFSIEKKQEDDKKES